ncbi:MAG: DUF6398 domain-containing protein [Nanoarchaeota archaeon]|nr:DUF6398 domain-containing protein [Nanoarchaeota archaeon]
MNFKEKKDPVKELIFGLDLKFTSEDKEQIERLIESYFRKRTNIVNSNVENLAGGLLWVYSRINFLFQDDESWSQQNIAGILNIKPKTISNTASRMMDSLRIDYFDKRFARKEVSEEDPRNNFVMTKEGLILHKNDIKELIVNRMLKEEPAVKLFDEDDIEDISYENKSIQKENEDWENKNRKLSEFFK